MIDHPETIEVIEVIEAIEVDPPKTAIPLTPSEAIDPNTDPNPDYPTFNLLKYKWNKVNHLWKGFNRFLLLIDINRKIVYLQPTVSWAPN